MIRFFILAGIGEGVVIVSVPALIGQEAPGELRGSIIGVAASFGAIGITRRKFFAFVPG